jgi:flagellar biosynthesis protein FlhF
MAQQTVSITPGQKYKFIVKSAEEAASIIREKLGESAQVISVRQVEGEGLARFLKSPKLEIIAQVPSDPSKSLPSPAPDPTGQLQTQAEADEDYLAQEPSQRRKPTRARKARGPQEPKRDDTDLVPESLVRAMFKNLPTGRLWTILSKAGIPGEFLAQFGERPESRQLNEQPLQTAISHFAMLMRDRAPSRSLALSNRVAFFGSPGSGSTTALCKQLASDVFLRGRQACVMKLEADEPNSSEGLAMFCEALGVQLLRTRGELKKLDEDTNLYFDIPGMVLTGKNVRHLQKTFDELGIESRVLVVNAAYERQLIQEAYTRAGSLGATHVVFTHVDEIPRCGKLWEFVLDDGLVPLFASTGQNIAADFDRHIIDLLVRRTLSAGDE